MDRSSILRASTNQRQEPCRQRAGRAPLRCGPAAGSRTELTGPEGRLHPARPAAPYFCFRNEKSKALLMSSKASFSSAATAMPSL